MTLSRRLLLKHHEASVWQDLLSWCLVGIVGHVESLLETLEKHQDRLPEYQGEDDVAKNMQRAERQASYERRNEE